MGTKTWVVIALIASVAYRWYPVTERNVIVLVNSNTYDLSELAQVKHLKAVFKIDRNIDEHMGESIADELKTKVWSKCKLMIKINQVLMKYYVAPIFYIITSFGRLEDV